MARRWRGGDAHRFRSGWAPGRAAAYRLPAERPAVDGRGSAVTAASTSIPQVLARCVAAAGSAPAGIAAACVELLRVDGAAVLLMGSDGGRWQVAAEVGALSAGLEEAQLTVGEGPAVEAFRGAGPVLVPDLVAAGGRWPGFAAVAPVLVRAVFAVPLQVGAVGFGVLDLYRCTPGRWDGPQLAAALQLADCAAEALMAVSAAGDPLTWLGELPGYTPEIDQAAGMCTVLLGVPLPVAYARLRGYAFAHGRSVREVSRAVVAGGLRLTDDSAGGGGIG